MSSYAPGTNTSEVEVLNVSPHGIWILVREQEFFLDTESYPWFADAKLRDVYDVTLHHGHHLHWPALDVDLHLESLEHPERFPLRSIR